MSWRRVWITLGMVLLFVTAVFTAYNSTTARSTSDRALQRTLDETRRRVAENVRLIAGLRAETQRATAAECAGLNQVYDVLRGLIFYATQPQPGATAEQVAAAQRARDAFASLIPTLDCPTFTPGPSKPSPSIPTTTTTTSVSGSAPGGGGTSGGGGPAAASTTRPRSGSAPGAATTTRPRPPATLLPPLPTLPTVTLPRLLAV